jgi:uncharacterized protein YwqG
MHYQTRVMPIDDGDGFVAVRCHGEHKIGGEDTREVHHAQVFLGHASDPIAARDVTSALFPPLPPSPGRAARQRAMADGQGELARSGQYSAATAAHYADNERSMRHAARLASLASMRVPRVVHSSSAGHLLCGFEPALKETSGEAMPGLLRLVSLADGSIREWSSARMPTQRPGRGVERYSSVQLGRPRAISLDGKRVVLPAHEPGRLGFAVCRVDDDLAEVARLPLPMAAVLPTTDGWLVVADTQIVVFDARGAVQRELPLSQQVVYWDAVAVPGGNAVVVPGHRGGEFWLVHGDGRAPRRFCPHRGAARDAAATLTVSRCGTWVASHCSGRIVVTRLDDGVSWPVAALDAEIIETPSFDGYTVRSHLPVGIGFIGSRLMTMHHGCVSGIALDAGESESFVSEQGRAGARKPVRVTSKMDFERWLVAAQLQHHAAALQRVYSPGVRMQSEPLGKAGWSTAFTLGAPRLGGSRLGGWPDLPPDMQWPRWNDRPMAFLCQIDLAEAHAVEPRLRLPKQGLLSFFIGCDEDTYTKDGDPRERYMIDEMVGTDAGTNAAWRVIHTIDTASLVRSACRDAPLPELSEPCAVHFAKGALALPDENAVAYEMLPFDADERDRYNELIEHLQPDDESTSEQLLGYPQLLQFTPPEWMCESSANGRDPWRMLAQAASEWGLLLQLTSNGDADFMWGDAGHLYFYGKREPMERGDFSGVWVSYEC